MPPPLSSRVDRRTQHPRRAPRRRPAVGWRLIAGAAALALACRAAPDRGPAFHDLVLDAPVSSDLDTPQRKTTLCSGETSWSLVLRGGEQLASPVLLGDAPQLVVESCIRLPERGEARDAGEVTVHVEPVGDGAPITARHPLRRGWQRLELDLAPLAGRPVRVRLAGDFATRRELYLRAAYVQHRVPVPPRATGPRVVLVSIDTLRADALGVYGGPWPTPNLDQLARESERFEQHWSGSSWTKPGHAAMLSGQPSEVTGAEDQQRPIRRSVKMLAERLREGGLATGALVTDVPWLAPKAGFARGFDEYRVVPWYAAQEVRAATNWLGARRDRPFFFFLHTFEVHSDFKQLPYEAPGESPKTVEVAHGVRDYGCREGSCASALLARIAAREIAPLAGEDAILRDLYGASTRHTDAVLGELFAALRELGLWDDTLLVVTADHGEVLLEHGDTLHGLAWEPVLRVPLLVKWPRGARAGRVHPGPSSALDLAPTLLAALGLPTTGLPGADLRDRPVREPVLAGWIGTWKAVRLGELKAVFHSNGAAELYDLAADPGELRDLDTARPEDLERLRRLVLRRARPDEAAAAHADEVIEEGATLTAEERERLRSLGYVF